LKISEVKRIKNLAKNKARKIVEDLNLKKLSYVKRIEAIHNYLCDTVTYPSKEPYKEKTYTAYGALIDGSAVCDGYARATQTLFEISGVKSMYIWGPVIGRGLHAWNLVSISGKWYQLDVTWDDCLSNLDYYLVTDKYMKLSRTWDFKKYPKSSDKQYS